MTASRDGDGAPIDVLMATYDGESFVGDQIESILRQSHPDWKLTVQDDCSTDGTGTVIRDYARQHPDRIVARERGSNSGSAKQNFFELLLASRARYVMLCDQDDVWLDDKIAVTLQRMMEMERRHGADTPLLVHSDLTVTDTALRVTARSMMAAQQLDGRESRLNRLVVQNTVTGCTVMVNRALVTMVREPFDRIVMHDWWLALIASAFGAIGFVDTPTALYRQHDTNAVGARPSRGLAYKVDRLLDREGITTALAESFAQAAVLLEHFEDRLSDVQVEMLRAYVTIPQLGKAGRLRTLRRHGFWKNTAVRRLGQVLYV